MLANKLSVHVQWQSQKKLLADKHGMSDTQMNKLHRTVKDTHLGKSELRPQN